MSTLEDLVRRKDRPLPSHGCSWAFYIVLLLLIVTLIILFITYRHQ